MRTAPSPAVRIVVAVLLGGWFGLVLWGTLRPESPLYELPPNLVPLAGLLRIVRTASGPETPLFQVAVNLLLLAPLGFLGPLLWRALGRWPVLLVVSATLSSLIELTQGVRVGDGRSADIDDVILNAVGALLGLLLLRLTGRLPPG